MAVLYSPAPGAGMELRLSQRPVRVIRHAAAAASYADCTVLQSDQPLHLQQLNFVNGDKNQDLV